LSAGGPFAYAEQGHRPDNCGGEPGGSGDLEGFFFMLILWGHLALPIRIVRGNEGVDLGPIRSLRSTRRDR
jgi:hypothetical protein